MPDFLNKQYITEFHPDIIKAVPALPTASSYTGSRFHQTTDNTTYYSDGTNWLSTVEYPVTMPYTGAALAATGNAGIVDSPTAGPKIYVTRLVAASITAATYDVTNNWSLQLQRQDNAGTNQNVGSAISNWATSRVTTRRYIVTSTINTLFTVDTDALLWITRWVKNSAPGNVSVESSTLWFRLVG